MDQIRAEAACGHAGGTVSMKRLRRCGWTVHHMYERGCTSHVDGRTRGSRRAGTKPFGRTGGWAHHVRAGRAGRGRRRPQVWAGAARRRLRRLRRLQAVKHCPETGLEVLQGVPLAGSRSAFAAALLAKTLGPRPRRDAHERSESIMHDECKARLGPAQHRSNLRELWRARGAAALLSCSWGLPSQRHQEMNGQVCTKRVMKSWQCSQ